MSLRAVYWLLRELGIPPRPVGRPRKLTPAEQRAVLAAFERGETGLAIAVRLGVSSTVVYRARNGRSRSERENRSTWNVTV